MPEKKKQHFIPKFYLRLFANEEKQFSIFNVQTKKPLNNIFCDNQCHKDYYYGSDHVWEDKLAEMESTWGVIFQKVLSKTPLTSLDIANIKQFALYQRFRTCGESSYVNKTREEMTIEMGKNIYAHEGRPFGDSAEKACKIVAKNNELSPADSLSNAEKFLPYIDDLSILVIEYNTQTKLISSDVPVILINPFHMHTIGFSCIGLIILFPISPNKLVVLYDSEAYPRFNNKIYVTLDNETEVKKLNVLQLISAEKILFSLDEKPFKSFTKEDFLCRSKNRDANTVSSLGPTGQQMFFTTPRKTTLLHTFSFGKLKNEFSDIPFTCREAVPRQWEEGWEKKLKDKIHLLPNVSAMVPDGLKNIGLTKKQLRKGCEEMLSLAKRYYWRKPN